MKKPAYRLNSNGEFVIENYNHSKPFANFFPGIAGKYGIPMWTFYVNRAQCISSFGVKDKDHSILEFYPANKSWQTVSALGFRTFIKLGANKKPLFYEPFHNGLSNLSYKLTNRMRISSHSLAIEEENQTLGLTLKVEYFNIPNDSFAGLARIVTVKNTRKLPQEIQLIDGLPQIIPYGTNNFFLKKMSRTIEAWMQVENLENKVPYYRLAVDPADRPEVIHIKEGNFYLGFHYNKNKAEIITPIVDPQVIFGPVTDFSCPTRFLETKLSLPKDQIAKSKTPSAFILLNAKLKPGEEKTLFVTSGNMRNIEILNSAVKKITKPGYLKNKKEENKLLIENLENNITTESASKEFNFYTKQTYLDNILRGGCPQVFKNGATFYLYSRKHGDLERDYNKFNLQPTYFSQGNGNYRDINQNRRSDIWFNPQIKDDNLINFFNLLQTDGFNPLVIHGASFILNDKNELRNRLKKLTDAKSAEDIINFLIKPFSPGDIIFFIEENNIQLSSTYDELLEIVIASSIKNQEAEHGEGFWTDHWTYNLDLIENYLKVYPEKLEEILFNKKIFSFFDNTEVVKPRHEKYVLYNNLPRQLHSISSDHTKKELIKKRKTAAHTVRTQNGTGQIYYTNLLNKLLCLVVNKLSSLDPQGCGIEMEADKPNWYDSLNGLPALFGSSLCETFELKRLVTFVISSLRESSPDKITVTEEILGLLTGLNSLIEKYLTNQSGPRDFEYWDNSNLLKEEYRQKTKLGLSGNELEITNAELLKILNNALAKINLGLAKAKDAKKDLYYSYFINQVTEYEALGDHYIKPTKFKQIRLPLFLEGQMHALRLSGDFKKAKALHQATKKSSLFDQKLKMYKVTAPLSSMPEEIGRCRVFPPGWLENESIWLHMEYKYLLELLKNNLHEEFIEEFKNTLVAFQKPAQYGRSILENSSFIVSSAFADKNLHGNGFVARLSGSTAEFLEIWLLMNIGTKGFFLNNQNELNFLFAPLLPGWLFNKNGTYSFTFLGKTKITYYNPKRKNTFGRNAPKINSIKFLDNQGNNVEINSNTLPSAYAEQLRSQKLTNINIYLN